MEENLQEAIELVNNSTDAYCHYITPNDIGITGGHQCGFYFPHWAEPMFYGRMMEKGSNYDVHLDIRWQKDFVTKSRAVYYGKGTRNENRITNFGRGFEFMQDCYLGSLQIVTKNEGGEFDIYILTNQDNIEQFIATFNLDITVRNQQINKNDKAVSSDEKINKSIISLVNGIDCFPETKNMAQYARNIVNEIYGYNKSAIQKSCDSIILKWIDAEYKLFSCIEEKVYKDVYTQPFEDCSKLIEFANKILNRRKSRAGKSLEHHLATIFDSCELKYESQVITEDNKKPDFIFPDGESYHNFEFPADKLYMLGAKTTCKDRWRQVLNEANRIPDKHLFTLQQGVSKNQLKEMADEHLTLVVPKDNITAFHPDFRDNILDLNTFIQMVKEKQA